MYWTPEGERCLTGAEARLFVESLAMIVDLLTVDDGSFGITVIDDLQYGQKLVAFESMASALLCKDVPVVPLTAPIEAAVAVVFHVISEGIQDELGTGNPPMCDEDNAALRSWRELVLAASQETGISGELPPADSTDLDEWQVLLECLSGRILWDEDWADGELHLDLPPEAATAVKSAMGIDGDYFTAIPRDPSDAEIPQLVSRLRELTGSAR